MSVTFHAIYSDGATYRVVYDPKERKTYLRTTDGGFMDVPSLVNGAEFIRYDFDYTPPKGLRPCDWADNTRRLHAHLALFVAPQKPATESATAPTQQILQTEHTVHLEERLPGESRLGQLQRSVGRDELEARASRQREIKKQVAQSDRPDARQIAAAAEIRRLNNLQARWTKPRGGGGGFGEGFVG